MQTSRKHEQSKFALQRRTRKLVERKNMQIVCYNNKSKKHVKQKKSELQSNTKKFFSQQNVVLQNSKSNKHVSSKQHVSLKNNVLLNNNKSKRLVKKKTIEDFCMQTLFCQIFEQYEISSTYSKSSSEENRKVCRERVRSDFII